MNTDKQLPIKIDLPADFLEEEIRNDYPVSTKHKELWAVELDLLSAVDTVCRRHSIPYFACAGTMLGAVRHQGMIPWDDDIDIMLLRRDYDRLCSFADEFEFPYFFQTESSDKGSMRGHAQLRNSSTTGILAYDISGKHSFNQGIFIDIFPLDNLPDDPEEKNKYINYLRKLKKRCTRVRDIPAHPGASDSGIKNAIRAMISPFLIFFDKHFELSHRLYLKFEREMLRYETITTKKVGLLSMPHIADRYQWELSDFNGEPERVPFEFLSIPMPAGYSNMLRETYGEWEKPVEARTNHGELIFDCRTPYTEYIKNLSLQK